MGGGTSRLSLELRHGKNNERIIVKIKKVRKKREREREVDIIEEKTRTGEGL